MHAAELREYHKAPEGSFAASGTKPIRLDRHSIMRMANALNAEAKQFDEHSENPRFTDSSRTIFISAAQENRDLSAYLIDQYNKA